MIDVQGSRTTYVINIVITESTICVRNKLLINRISQISVPGKKQLLHQWIQLLIEKGVVKCDDKMSAPYAHAIIDQSNQLNKP